MRIGNVVDLITTRYNNENMRKRALFLLGNSGVGKSDVVRQAAASLGIEVRDLRLSQCDPTDLRGVPSTLEGKTYWNHPANFPEEGTEGIFFLDEITSALPAVLAASYQLILDRALGDYVVPDGWIIVAAGNFKSDRGVTYTIPAPLMNRMSMFKIETTLEDFLNHGAVNGLDPRVMAFLGDRADLLHKFGKEDYGKQFPTPRSWFSIGDVLQLEQEPAVRAESIQADVGIEAGIVFESFMRVWETMPSINKILTEPDSVAIPESTDLRYCVTMGLAARITEENFDNAWSYLKRFTNMEFQTLAVKLAYQRDPDIQNAESFLDWSLATQDAAKR